MRRGKKLGQGKDGDYVRLGKSRSRNLSAWEKLVKGEEGGYSVSWELVKVVFFCFLCVYYLQRCTGGEVDQNL